MPGKVVGMSEARDYLPEPADLQDAGFTTVSGSHGDRRDRLLALVGDLASALSVERLIMSLRGSARSVAGADGITVVRREGDRVRYVAEDAVSSLWEGQSFSVEQCISGLAMIENRPIVIPDVYVDSRVPIDAYQRTFVRSMAMFPIGRSAPTLAMGAYWAKAGMPDPEVIQLLASLARAAGSSFERIGRKERGTAGSPQARSSSPSGARESTPLPPLAS